MPRNGPIIVVEDDTDDQDIIKEVLKNLAVSNLLYFFKNGQEALDYIKQTVEKPLIILCDINMPLMDGLQFRTAIEADPLLRIKSIPFVFLSTTNNQTAVRKAYDLTVQGFFQKCNTLEEMSNNLKLIIDYWSNCLHPES